MTDIAERLAVELMGWIRMTHCSPEYWNDGHQHVIQTKHWNPTEDLNQARLCLLELGEMGAGAQRDYMEHLYRIVNDHSHPGYRIPDADLHLYVRSDSMWWTLTATPAQICEAIITVLDEMKEEKP